MFQPSGRQALLQRAWASGPFYSEGDFESADFPLFAVAANFEKNDFHGTTTGNDLRDTVYGLDFIYKYKRFCATGEYYFRERTPEIGSKFRSDGFFGQATYLVTSRKVWEVGLRYGQFDPTNRAGSNLRKEIRGALSYYYHHHTFKVQADLGRLIDQAGNSGIGTKNGEFRLQSQFVF
ncbi:MAG: hypothetical protein ABIR28_13685 [Vicinamibacteria bacterium]